MPELPGAQRAYRTAPESPGRRRFMWEAAFSICFLSILLNWDLGPALFGLPITTQKLALALAAVLYVLAAAVERGRPVRLANPITVPLTAYTLAVIVSALPTVAEPAVLEGVMTQVLILVGVHLLVFLVRMAHPSWFLRLFASKLPVLISVSIGLNFIYWMSDPLAPARMSGLQGNPNSLATVLFMSLPYSVASAVWNRGIKRIAALACVSATLGFLIVTFSRSVWIALFCWLALSMVSALSHRSGRRRLLVATLVVAVAAVITLSLVPDSVESLVLLRIGSAFTWTGVVSGEPSIALRVQAIPLAWQLWTTAPLTGIGIRGFRAWTQSTPAPWGLSAVENTYLGVLCETGLLGFTAFLVCLVVILRSLYRASRTAQHPFLRLLGSLCFTSFGASLLLLAMNDLADKMALFWLWVGLALSLPILDALGERRVERWAETR